MKRPTRIKFVWGAADTIAGRWYGGLVGFYSRKSGDRSRALAISVRGLLGWTGALAVVCYIGATAVLYGIWSRNPYNLLTYPDVLLWPLRRAEVAEKKGRAMLARGQELFRDEKYIEAVVYLRAGLARVPQDLPARLSLARFYAMANNRAMAGRVLADGLGPRYPGRLYLERTIQFALENEDYEAMVALADRYVGEPLPPGERRWLAEVRFQALLAAERGEEALAGTEVVPQTNVDAERRVRALLALRRYDDARAAVDAWQAAPWAERVRVLRARVQVTQEAGQRGEMEAALVELAALTPADPAVLAHRVVDRARAGLRPEAEAAWEDYLFRFGGKAQHLLSVAEPAARAGVVWLADRAIAAAAERGYPLARFQGLRMHACLVAGDWDGALLALRAVQAGRNADPSITWFEQLIAAARNGADASQTELLEKLRARPWPARYFQSAADVLIRAGRLETARAVLEQGQSAFPHSESLRRLNLELAQRDAAAPAKPEASPEHWDEAEVFRRLGEFAKARNWSAVEAAIDALRRANPPPEFLVRRDADLWLHMLPVFRSRGDWGALAQSVRQAVGRQTSRIAPVLAVARQFREEGDAVAARRVIEELNRQFPDSRPLQGIMARWQAGDRG